MPDFAEFDSRSFETEAFQNSNNLRNRILKVVYIVQALTAMTEVVITRYLDYITDQVGVISDIMYTTRE